MNNRIVALAITAILSAIPALAQEPGGTEVKEDGKGGLYLPTRTRGGIGVVASGGEYVGFAAVEFPRDLHLTADKKLLVRTPGDRFRRVPVKGLKPDDKDKANIKLPITKSEFMAIR